MTFWIVIGAVAAFFVVAAVVGWAACAVGGQSEERCSYRRSWVLAQVPQRPEFGKGAAGAHGSLVEGSASTEVQS